jgi:hypothetical protein
MTSAFIRPAKLIGEQDKQTTGGQTRSDVELEFIVDEYPPLWTVWIRLSGRSNIVQH